MSLRALVVDEDYDAQSVLSELLQLHNIEVVGVGKNGKEAVNLYREKRPDVVLLDLMMPKYDGFYGLEQIRKFDPNSKVIVFTGRSDIKTKKRVKELGALAIISKTDEIEDIIRSIHDVTEKNSQLQEEYFSPRDEKRPRGLKKLKNYLGTAFDRL